MERLRCALYRLEKAQSHPGTGRRHRWQSGSIAVSSAHELGGFGKCQPAWCMQVTMTHTTEGAIASSPSPPSFYPSGAGNICCLRAFALSISMWLALSTPEELSSNVMPSGCPSLAVSLIHCPSPRMLQESTIQQEGHASHICHITLYSEHIKKEMHLNYFSLILLFNLTCSEYCHSICDQ